MLKAKLRVQLLGEERNLNGNLKATTTQTKNAGQKFSTLNPSLSCEQKIVNFEFRCIPCEMGFGIPR